jgi:hypothetical protein
MNKKEFCELINKLRLLNKNNWYFWSGTVEGLRVQVKGYDTWTQILDIESTRHGGTMNISVAAFKKHLSDSIDYHFSK